MRYQIKDTVKNSKNVNGSNSLPSKYDRYAQSNQSSIKTYKQKNKGDGKQEILEIVASIYSENHLRVNFNVKYIKPRKRTSRETRMKEPKFDNLVRRRPI